MGKMKLPAQIYDASDNPDGGIYLRVAYDPDFLVEFKAAVPAEHLRGMQTTGNGG